MVSIDLVVGVVIFGLLLLALRPGSSGFPVTIALLPKAPLPFSGALTVQIARFTVRAVVNLGHLSTMVVALDVLPCLASLAEDRVPIVILKGTNAFDGVGLVLFWLDRVRDGAVGRRGVQRSGDRIRFRSRMRGCE
jgi:hypothetical protein